MIKLDDPDSLIEDLLKFSDFNADGKVILKKNFISKNEFFL